MKIKLKIKTPKKPPQNISEANRAEKAGFVQQDLLDKLKQHISLDRFNPSHYVTFHSVNKVGINPQTEYNTPVGIYAYPVNQELINQIESGNVPFASNAAYVSILKLKEGVKLLTVNSNIGLRHWTKLMSSETVGRFNLEDTSFEEEVRAIESRALELKGDSFPEWTAIWREKLSPTYWASDKKRKRKNDYAHIWLATKMIAGGNPAKWNGILRYMGFDGAIDVGQGIIHRNEKQQAVFFSKKAIEVVTTMDNKYQKRKVRGTARN